MFWPVSGCWTKKPVAMPFFSVVARSASASPPHLHSSRKRCSAGRARQTRRQRMLRRNRAVGNPHDCIGARGKDAQRFRLTVQMLGKGNRNTLAFTDPLLQHSVRRDHTGSATTESGWLKLGKYAWLHAVQPYRPEYPRTVAT